MAEQTEKTMRISLDYFDGVNTLVSSSIAKKNELSACLNCRSTEIGSLVKRAGSERLGDSIIATANYGIFYFGNDNNNGFYRISKVGGTTTIYYLSSADAWTAITSNGTGLTATQFSGVNAESNFFLVNGTDNNKYIDSNGTLINTSADLGSSTTQFDISDEGSNTFRYTYDGNGTDPDTDGNIKVGTVLFIRGQNFTTANNGVFTVTAVSTNYFEVTNASGVAESNKTIGTGFIRVSGHLYGSPKAYKINYYKNRLYLADYTTGSTRNRNGIMLSSTPLGIVSLVDGDHAAGSTTIKCTDTKYIHATDYLEVWRGGTEIETLIVTSKTEDSITVTATSNALESSDELWVPETRSGAKVFRWADNPSSGIDVKQYDTFKLSGGQNDSITMMTNIGDVMMLGNKNNLAIWNNYALQNFDLGIGCVSGNGYVKSVGTLFFIHYSGIYSTTGGLPKLMSSKVQKYIDGATTANLEAAAAGKKGLSVFFAIGDVTLYHPDGSTNKTISDVVLEYDLRTTNWYVHSGITATQFATYISSDDPDRLIYSSTETGYHLKEFLKDDTLVDDNGNANTEILFQADTNNIPLSKQFENISYPIEAIVESERGSGIQCFVSFDLGQPYELKGDARKGVSILKIHNKSEDDTSPPRCRAIKLSFKSFNKARCKIGRIAIKFLASAETENQRDTNYNT